MPKKNDDEKLAHAMYEKYLNGVVEPLIGKDSTYLTQLDGAGHKLLGAKFRGVYPSDKIPKLNDLSCYAILNLDKTGEPGSHWVAIAKSGAATVLYDSFARDDKKIIPNLHFSGNGRIIDGNKEADQKPHEMNCGARCLAWLLVLDKYGMKMARYV